MTRQVNHHAAGIIIYSQSSGSFLLGRYDDTYPFTEFQNTHSLIGGNYEKGDVGPLELLTREVNEEINFTSQDPQFAQKMERRVLSREILTDVEPFADYFITDPPTERRGGKTSDNLYSIFKSEISEVVMDIARRNLDAGLRIMNEGNSGIQNVKELRKIHLAWCSPIVMSDYIGESLPNPYGAKAERIGMPRESFEDYTPDFEYTNHQDQ